MRRYWTHGADATSIPKPGEPGAEYFTQGADVTSVPKPGQPGAEYFTHGADVTSVPKPGQPGAEYFTRGADVMAGAPVQVPAPTTPRPVAPTAVPTPEAATETRMAQAAARASSPPASSTQPPTAAYTREEWREGLRRASQDARSTTHASSSPVASGRAQTTAVPSRATSPTPRADAAAMETNVARPKSALQRVIDVVRVYTVASAIAFALVVVGMLSALAALVARIRASERRVLR